MKSLLPGNKSDVALYVKEFHVAVLEKSEFQSLRGVVDLCCHDRGWQFDFVGHGLIYIEQ